MSYDISLVDPVTRETLRVDTRHLIGGGTQVLGGTNELWLNITWNYSKLFCDLFDGDKGIRTIYGLTGAESIPILKGVIQRLKDEVTEDYWEASQGNAKRALCGLLAFAQLRPDGIWEGD